MGKVSDKGSGDTLERLKDLYATKEREAENKHRDEIHELNKTHQAEFDKLKTETNNRIKSLQEQNNAKLNQRDLQFQKEVDAMRALYQKRATEGKKLPESET